MSRITRTGAAFAAVGATAALALSACGTTNSTSSSGPCTSIAFLGAETGPNAQLGLNMVGGIKLALSQYNAKHANAQIKFQGFDSQGDPKQAPALATKIVGDSSICGVVGPGFSGESDATGKTFFEAGYPSISASATNVKLTQNGWTTWHRVIGNDAAQGAADAKYITTTLGAKKVFVIDDASTYGKGLATVVSGALGSAVTGTDEVTTGQTDFSATVAKVKGANVDALFYGGYYAESGLLVKQLRAAGWTGKFVSGDGSEDPAFITTAGAAAANGALLSAPAGPAPASFAAEYKAANGTAAGLYSTQAYDATNVFLAALEAGKTSRSDINTFIGSYTGTGVSGPIAFDSKGDIKETTIWMYTVKNGVLDVNNPTPIH
jgi:branched-chain amino acid transport system substrate-binding protein